MEQSSEISRILPHLFISDWNASQNSKKLAKDDIKAILTVEMTPKPNDVRTYYAQNEIDFMQIAAHDDPSENISRYFDQTYDFIDKHILNDKNVLVHCAAGISRSVTIVANYLVRRLYERAKLTNAVLNPEETVRKALDTIRQGRSIANPNPGFLQQLREKAQNYSKSYGKSGLNSIPPTNNPMCDKSFVDASGKPANVICLTDQDFDAQGNLVNFKDVAGVVFFSASWCHFCQTTKPEFVKFANSIPTNVPIRAFSVDGVAEKQLISRINPAVWGYACGGFPTIVGYAGGKFYSEYAPSNDKPQLFRKSDDIIEYAMGLGKAPVEVVKSR